MTAGKAHVVLEVTEPGLLTTIQDSGRPGALPMGVPPAGACDPLALAAANLLVGNAHDAAVLEINLLGPQLTVRRPTLIGLTGADCEVRIEPSGAELRPGSARRMSAGDRILFGAAVDGARACLSIAGGFDVPPMLGSLSTSLSGGFGGLDGRPLRTGDLLVAGVPAMGSLAWLDRGWPGPGPSSGVPLGDDVELRVMRGPHAGLGGGAAWKRLIAGGWEVDPRSDRVGVRLLPHDPLAEPPVQGRHDPSSGLVSIPMIWGALEMPPGGAPIALLADHPTVGGYPVVGVVVSADLPLLGQLRTGHRLTFRPVGLDEALDAARKAEEMLTEAEARLRDLGA